MSESIKVFPNPVSDLLNVQFEDMNMENAKYQLFDLQGKLIEEKSLNSITNQIDASTLPNGTYMLNINQSDKLLQTFKILKNK